MLIFKLVVGLAILFLLYQEFKGPLMDLLHKVNQKAKEQEKDVEPEKNEDTMKSPGVVDVPAPSLSMIVAKWEELRNMCRKYNLKDAEDKLEEVFPLLLDDEEVK